MKLKPYLNYKDSNVDWIGKIPEEWNTLKSSLIFSRINNHSHTGNEVLLSVSEFYGIKPKIDTLGNGDFLTHAESLIGYKKCSKNDLIMNIMLAWKKGLGITEFDGIVSPAYEVFKTNILIALPKYLHYLLRIGLYTTEFKKHSYGIIDSRLRLYPENFKNIPCIIPPKINQKEIVSFLDKKTKIIDNTIEKDKELIELLKEKRNALINQAVTKGLNPNVPMKDSGIEWIGEIPENWNVDKIKYLLKETVTDGPHETPEFLDEGIPFLSVDSIQDGKLVFDNCRFISKLDFNKFKQKCNPKRNDVFMGKAASVGKIAIVNVDFEFGIWSPLALLRPNQNKILPKFLEYSLKSRYSQYQIELYVNTNTQKNIGMKDIPKIRLTLPPLKIQKKIVEFLDKETDYIGEIIDKTETKIGLLEEYKESLIYNVVTGKVDVRGVEV